MKKKVIIICLAIFIVMLVSISSIFIIKNINKNISPEELSDFSWEAKLFKVNDDYTYTFSGLVTVQEVEGIDIIKYQKNGKEIIVNGNGKQKIGIDFDAVEDTDYEFKITPVGKSEKTKILNVKRKVSGNNTYKLVNGVYINTPFLENFNDKYTRYLSVTDDNTLTPANWIFDEEPDNWYDYNNQKWANIYVEAEGVEVYYVWIPRYVYKLDQTTQRSDVKFVDVYNNFTDASTGQVTSFKELIAQGYQLPEAFTWGDAEATEISGYWISKYQLSELEKFNIDYNMAASKSSIVLSNYTNNVANKAKTYTYAINGKIVNNSTTLDEYTFNGLTENQSYIVNVTALDANGTIVGSMTKLLEPTEVNPPKLDGFDPDTTFYVYYDEDGIEHNEIPINQNAPEAWYDYGTRNWANIVTRNDGLESYYVWIPRYQYSLNQNTETSSVKFIKGTDTKTDEGYQIPEAFTWGDDGEKQLTGYWMSKYQLSTEEATARINAEISAGGNVIRIGDITGTALTTEDGSGNSVPVSMKYEYYLNGNKVHDGTSATEKYSYTGLSLNTTYTVNIIARNASTNEYVGAITKKIKTTDVYTPDLTGFDKDTTFYVIYNDDGTEKERVSIKKNAPSNWYDYSNRKWANIVTTANGTESYFVWIPRYEYRILEDRENESLDNKRTDVNFITTDITNDNCSTGYKVPEAFTWGDNGEKQLTGYWMSKYQLSE